MDAPIIQGIITAVGTLVAALTVGGFSLHVSRKYTAARNAQDREAEWRKHAVELTKLEVERKKGSGRPQRPVILDFLALYRDLKELDKLPPKTVYENVLKKRINSEAETTVGRPAKAEERAAPEVPPTETALPESVVHGQVRVEVEVAVEGEGEDPTAPKRVFQNP